jgi:hypothetical protein
MNTTKTINPFWDDIDYLFEHQRREFDFNIDIYRQHWEKRDTCCRLYAWAITDPDSLCFVAEHLGPRAIEIGAGNGYWAWQLSQLGIDIIAYDTTPPDKVPNMYFAPQEEAAEPKSLTKTWYPVHLGGPEKVREHPDRTLFLCWPPYSETLAYQCLQSYQGNRFVFIGEGDGGCTGDDAFFKLLDEQWEDIAEHDIKQWEGIHDYITVYQRKA